MLCGFMGDSPRLIPQSRMKEFEKPPETLPRPIPELDQWIRAVKGGPASDANFVDVHPMAETIERLDQAIKVIKPGFVFIDTLTNATIRDLCEPKARNGMQRESGRAFREARSRGTR